MGALANVAFRLRWELRHGHGGRVNHCLGHVERRSGSSRFLVMRCAVGTWGFMGIGGSLGKHAVSSGQKADWRRAGYKRSVNADIEDNALIVQRTTRRRSRGVITRVQRPLRPTLGRSWALQGVGIRALTPWKSLWECCDKDGGEVGRNPKRMNENGMGNGNGNGDGMGGEG